MSKDPDVVLQVGQAGSFDRLLPGQEAALSMPATALPPLKLNVTDTAGGKRFDFQFQKGGRVVIQRPTGGEVELGEGFTWEDAVRLLADYFSGGFISSIRTWQSAPGSLVNVDVNLTDTATGPPIDPDNPNLK